MAVKKPAIMTKVHIVRVMKVCFFFSYSDCGGVSVSSYKYGDQHWLMILARSRQKWCFCVENLPLLCLSPASHSYLLLLDCLALKRPRSRIHWVFFHYDDCSPYVEIGRYALAWPWLSVEGAQLRLCQLLCFKVKSRNPSGRRVAQDSLDNRTLSGSGELNIKPMVLWRKEAWRGRGKGRGSAVDWRFDAGQISPWDSWEGWALEFVSVSSWNKCQ